MKRFLVAVLVMASFLVCSVSVSGAKTYKFTLQNMFSMNHPVSQGLQKMIDDLKKMTNGQIDIQALPPGALVKAPQVFESVGAGALDMGTTCSCYHAGILEVGATAFALPGDPRNVWEILSFIYDEGIMEFFRQAYAAHNVVYGAPLGLPGYALVSKKPVKSWEDLSKLKVRATGSIAKNLKALGVPTVFIPFEEIYVGLARGTIDAEISGAHSESMLAKTYEVARYQMTPQVSGAQNCEIIVNKKKWDELPPNLKAMFEVALKAFAFDVARLFEKEERTARSFMESKGAEYVELPLEVMKKWQAASMQLWDDLAKQDAQCAEYIKRTKEHLKVLGY